MNCRVRTLLRLLCLVTSLLPIACRNEARRNDRAAEVGSKLPGAQTAPRPEASVRVIRIGYPGVGIGGRPYLGGTVAATVHGRRALETEFARDGIEVSWSLNKGAGPAVNELIASRQLDFAYLGDLPAIVGRSIGLDTKIILAGGRGGNIYLAVNNRSPYHRLAELRGKRMAIFKGTALQLQGDRVLGQLGYSEGDFKTITMDQASGLAALIGGDVDALWAQFPIFEYEQRGDVRIVTSSREPRPDGGKLATAFGVLLVTGQFEREHPELVQRVVSAYVREADWSADPAHQAELYKLWSRAGYPEVVFYKEHAGADLLPRVSPLLDAQFIEEVRAGADASVKLNLIRKPINIVGWFESKYVDKALKELNLEQRWKPQDVATR